MYLTHRLSPTSLINIVVSYYTEYRLKQTCFRGTEHRNAGNFLNWKSPLEMFHDHLVISEFMDDVRELWRNRDFGDFSVEITHDKYIGWDSTDDVAKYPTEMKFTRLEKGQWRALQIHPDDTGVQAPLTKRLTIVYSFGEDKKNKGQYVAFIHSIYPGEDIGELDGDVTKREGRVFFDWNHRGQMTRSHR